MNLSSALLNNNNHSKSWEKRCIPIWNKKIMNTELEKFKNLIEKKYKLHFSSYWDLHKWSVENFPDFWKEIWHYFNVISSKPYIEIFGKTGNGFLDNVWFKGATFNLAENILRVTDDTTGIIYEDELGHKEKFSFAEIYLQVKLYAAAFRKIGLGIGDVVCYYISNRPEAVFAMLAATSIGAIWGGPLSFHGGRAALSIVKILNPTIMISIDHFQFNGKHYYPIDNLPAIVKEIPRLKQVIIVTTKKETLSRDISDIPKSIFLDDFLKIGMTSDETIPRIIYEQLPFNHPTIINFTSGTTGDPKGVVHSAGALIAQLRDFALHLNLKRGDMMFTYAPVGWAIWDYMIPNLALGVALFLFDGCPDYTRGDYSIWNILSENKVSCTFLSPTFVETFATHNIIPQPGTTFDCLKTFILAGSPIRPQDYNFLYNKVKRDVFVCSLYGATESLGAFSGCDLNSTSYACECQVPALGVDIHCLDEQGNPVVGQRGEFVVTKPCPIFPIYLWKDENNEKLNEEYLSKYPGSWCQNDEVWINPVTRGLVIIGRSDNTLKQYGERLSSSDIYFAIRDIEELEDFICVGQDRWDGRSRTVLFVKLRQSYFFTPQLKEKIENSIRKEVTDNVPEVILEIPEIPYNLNNKRMESVVKKIVISNKIPEVKNIRNPECLKYYCNIPELVSYNDIDDEYVFSL